MNGFVFPSMECLESRRLLSATFATGGLCLLPPPTRAPTPAPIPVPTTPRHHHRSHAAVTSPSPIGNWATGDAALNVQVSQARNGDLFAKVAFTGATSFQGSAQLTYSSTTGQYTMWVMSPRLVVKFSGRMATTGEFQGSLETYTRKGAFKGQFVLQKTNFPPAGSL